MKILALEFSTGQRSVAVVVDGEARSAAMETATRATPAFGLIERTLAAAQMQREDIECLAVGLGPGSYTGIRSAIALAQGWQLGLAVKLLGISSVECLAAEAREKGWFGTVNLVIDAQRNEFYLARYEVGSKGCREVEGLKLAGMDEVHKHIKAGELVAGPEVGRWFADGHTLFPGAAILGRLAEARKDFVAGERLEPIYLRETAFVKAPPPRVLPMD